MQRFWLKKNVDKFERASEESDKVLFATKVLNGTVCIQNAMNELIAANFKWKITPFVSFAMQS